MVFPQERTASAIGFSGGSGAGLIAGMARFYKSPFPRDNLPFVYL